ncbi:NAD(P)-binding protein, partial [Paenarthrobacter sp. CM16]|uniref:FAD-dependent monooxygenase n=1 Tax=Paenarthrobacter sp. CM16 TaxID=2738447 RepID=UPI001553F88C
MAAVQRVGIVGAGAAGLTAAILLAEAGVEVEVLEKAAEPQTLGSGITLQGNALRILRDLGVWEQVQAKGYSFSTLGLRAPDPAGTVVAVLEDIRTGGEDLPATLGMYRPDLTAILRGRAEQAGTRISYGKTVTEIADDGGTVTVLTAD